MKSRDVRASKCFSLGGFPLFLDLYRSGAVIYMMHDGRFLVVWLTRTDLCPTLFHFPHEIMSKIVSQTGDANKADAAIPTTATVVTGAAEPDKPSASVKELNPAWDDVEALRPPGSDKVAGPTRLQDLSPEQRKILDDFRERLQQTTSEEWYQILLAEKAKKEAAEKALELQKVTSDENASLPLVDKERLLRDRLIQSEREALEASQKAEKERLEKGLAELDLAAKRAKKRPPGAKIDSWLDTVHRDAIATPAAEAASVASSLPAETKAQRRAAIRRRAQRDLRMADYVYDELMSQCNDYRAYFDARHRAVREAIIEDARSAETEETGSASIVLASTACPTILSSKSSTATGTIPDEISSGSIADTALGQYLRLGRFTAFGRAKSGAPVRIYHTDTGEVHAGVDIPIDQYLPPHKIPQLGYLADIYGSKILKEFRDTQRNLAVTQVPLVAVMSDIESERYKPSSSLSSATPPASTAGSAVVTPLSTPPSSVAGDPPAVLPPIMPLNPVEPDTEVVPGLDDTDNVSVTGSELEADGDDGGDKGFVGDDGASDIGGDGDAGSVISDGGDDAVTIAPTT